MLNSVEKNILYLKTIQYLPRWIIFSIDICIVIFSAIMGHLILQGIGIDFNSMLPISLVFLFFIAIHLFFFLYFKTSTGIVRHTTINDAAKLFVVELLSFITLYAVNCIIGLIYSKRLFLNTQLLLSIAITFCFLVLFRLAVKISFDFFSTYSSEKNQLIKAVIYGNDERAIAIANAINTEIPRKYKLQGFINPSTKSFNNRILDVPVIGKTRKIPVLVRGLGASTLIIAEENLTKDEKIDIIED